MKIWMNKSRKHISKNLILTSKSNSAAVVLGPGCGSSGDVLGGGTGLEGPGRGPDADPEVEGWQRGEEDPC